ncbi:NfeD family protein [Niabella drilacis]|uniref:NfeD-like C-terminal, partner-binding n=1 Tax=Niabella drilacis (strain DSM 25811 / CCM 8410 / CCUG 62505 / LMG 26954 / E90) TaxID=1285928 RepID=A0A1G6W9D8_NIADE|nr:NfeD family protein [Niabella drilacis]SDD62429.1 NfeD-like C-terminal, partner-binding [Niabella drilacis]
MNAFFEGMPSLLQGFWWVAIITSIVFLIQTVLTFAGGHGADGINADFDGDLTGADAPFQMFSLRNLINFLMGFGWTGVAFFHSMENKALLIALAVVIGIFFVLLFFFVIRQLMKLTEDNTFNAEKLIGKSGEVYLTIPEKRSGLGKIQISYNNTSHELTAVTEGERLFSGTLVKVLGIEDRILIVTKI